MEDLVKALETIKKYNGMPVKEFVELVDEYFGRIPVPEETIKNWECTGLNNIEYFKMSVDGQIDIIKEK